MMGIDQIGKADGYGYGNDHGTGYGNGFGDGGNGGNGYGSGDGYGYGNDIGTATENPHCTRLIDGDNIAFIHCQQVMLS